MPSLGYYAYKLGSRRDEANRKYLAEHGYLVTHAREENRGDVTLIWCSLPRPVPLYLRVFNRDPVQLVAAKLGIKDIKTGDAAFDKGYVVRSNHPELARKFLDKDFRSYFLSLAAATNCIDFVVEHLGYLCEHLWSEQKRPPSNFHSSSRIRRRTHATVSFPIPICILYFTLTP